MSKKVIKLTEKDLHRIIESVINEQRLSGDLFQIRNASGRALGEVVFNKTSVDNTMGLIRLYVKSGIKAEYVTYDCGSKRLRLKAGDGSKDIFGQEIMNDTVKKLLDTKFCENGKIKTKAYTMNEPFKGDSNMS
jgi:hypothetical protein